MAETDTPTFSKSWKRTARLLSSLPSRRDCKNSLIDAAFCSFLRFFQHTPHFMPEHTEAKCPRKASPLGGGESGNGIWFPVEMEEARGSIISLAGETPGKGG